MAPCIIPICITVNYILCNSYLYDDEGDVECVDRYGDDEDQEKHEDEDQSEDNVSEDTDEGA